MLRNKIKKYYTSQRLDENHKRMLTASLSEAYGEQGSINNIAVSHSKNKKEHGKQVYAKGPGLWGLGITAAAVAAVAGFSFFGGLDLLPIRSSPASYVQPDENGIGYFNMTIDGVKRTGKNNNEINVKDLKDYGNELTVNLEFPDVHIGEEYNVRSASYCVFIDGYDTVDLSDGDLQYCRDEFGSAGTVFEYYSDDLTETMDGLYAEYTFQLYDHRNEDLAFSIVAVAVFEDYDGNYSMMLDSVYNTAYSDREKFSYLKQLSNSGDPYPMTANIYDYFSSNVTNGLIDIAGTFKENTIDIIGDSGDSLYLEFFALNNSAPEYAYENAYYLLTFVDGVLLPHSTDVDTSELDSRYSGLTMVDCMQCDGNPVSFIAPLYMNELSDVHEVKAIAIPARPYGNNEVMSDTLDYSNSDSGQLSGGDLKMGVAGYDKLGEYNNEIHVDSLKNGDELTVMMKLREFPDDITSANFYVFLNGYVALDPEQLEDGDDCLQFFNYMGSGKFEVTDEGVYAEYTFTIDGISDKALPDNTFTIVALSTVDFTEDEYTYPDTKVDAIYNNAIYNTAYKNIWEVDYLEELYANVSPELSIFEKCRYPYDNAMTEAGFYLEGYSRKNECNGAAIVDSADDENAYISYYRGAYNDRKYLFQNACYLFMFIDHDGQDPNSYNPENCDIFTPLIVAADGNDYEDLLYNPMIICADSNGDPRYFYYSLDPDVGGAALIGTNVYPSASLGFITGQAVDYPNETSDQQ